jgi:hypothetical protein
VVDGGLLGGGGGLCDGSRGDGGEESEGRQFQGHRSFSLGDLCGLVGFRHGIAKQMERWNRGEPRTFQEISDAKLTTIRVTASPLNKLPVVLSCVFGRTGHGES